ncbi:MAG: nitroreductase family deazaflavin-dependent oxidoreductase [Candidatus Dormibacteraeota bacterium]|uniref:Nitroreductase family deazaflavin-dependent oxidoreductase n=1 Tax=Candidatus Dormiibacter inghamiae TaxID=3127013 RepID=A0A934KJ51_9BACT|nr:nitroreductase family deazaflavin-dependent oxidoreductase [Candidatus Dormibacteraeota bacterium]MBJ7607214.1 nitroreductase family deazaflavin-dependent oxidoreductase [Candidatus Dormibacteraeota bacterium]
MPLPKRLARFNRRVTNRVLGPLAVRTPWFGLVGHRGRRSGQLHWTPVNVFAIPEGYVIALTYGRVSQWPKNVLAAGSLELRTYRGSLRLGGTRLVRDPNLTLVPLPVRLVLRALKVDEFVFAWP